MTSTERPLAWITGAAGLIGHCLVQLAPDCAPGWRVRGLTRADFDLTDFAAVELAHRRDRPALIIHCAALSRSPACQADPALARRINVDTTRHLAGLGPDTAVVFFSTDLVFDGRSGHYNESATPNPLSVYGETKAEAERAVLAHPRGAVIRTSLNGGNSLAGDRAFNEEMRRAWSAGRSLKLFTDEFRSPIHACLTARAVWELALQKVAGIWHVAGAERLSRWEIGQLLAARWPELNPKLEPGSLREYAGAPRPPDTSLNCAKVQARLTFKLAGLGEWLAAHPHEQF